MYEHEYLNATVWATLKRSDIHGIGVIAIRPIPAGTRITDNTVNRPTDFHMFVLSQGEFLLLNPEIQTLILDRTLFEEGRKMKFISPNDDAVLRSFMNHSDTPNTDGEFALRDIQQGEELTESFRIENPHRLTVEHMSFLTVPTSTP